jgi:hypothetical protein
MGMSYTIDQARRIVRSRGWGVVSSRDLLDLTSRLLADPAFDPTFRGLTDLSDVTEVRVETPAMVESASTPTYIPGTRRAVVAPSDVAFGMARMFASYAERSGQEVRVFRAMREAEAWLEGAGPDDTA